jgi:hypothetical protein
MIPRKKAPNLLPAHNPDDARETPAETSSELVRARKPRLLPPATLSIARRRIRASLQKSLNKSLDGGCGYVHGESGENERGGETSRADLVRDDVYEPRDLFEPENDMALVREVTVVLLFGITLCVCMGVIPRAVEVQRQKTAIRDLRKKVLRVVVPRRTKGTIAFVFILLTRPSVPVLGPLCPKSNNWATRLSAGDPAKLVETCLGRIGGNPWVTVTEKSLTWI